MRKGSVPEDAQSGGCPGGGAGVSPARLVALLALFFIVIVSPPVSGSSFIEPGFFESLDLDRPGLEAVAQAVGAGAWEEAGRALLAYYAERPHPPGMDTAPQPAHPDFRALAEAVLRDEFTLQGVTGRQPRLENRGFDWRYRGPRGDKEWAWFFNRHFYFNDLLRAHQETGDERYRAAVAAILSDWVDTQPFPGRFSFSPAWRALEAARRVMNSWIPAFASLVDEPESYGDALLRMLRSLPDHAEKLKRFPSVWGGNHLITETAALFLLGTMWPEFRDAEVWRTHALQRLDRELSRQTYPEGAFKELSTHYQRVVLMSLQPVLPLLREDPSPEARSLLRKLETMWDYFILLARPDGIGPMNNASDQERIFDFAAHAHPFFDRPDWRYILSNGREGERPDDPPSRIFPYAGQAVLRSGWAPEDSWAFFDFGPHGAGHQHADRLHVSFFALGREWLADSGRYLYMPGPERDYFTGPWAHNVILLNGRATRPPPRVVHRPLPASFHFAEGWQLVAASAEFPPDVLRGRGPARHHRAVLFTMGDHLLVLDHILAFGPHQAEAIWNFAPEVTDAEVGQVVRLLATSTGLATSERRYRGSTSPFLGWFSPDYNEIEPSLQKHLRWSQNGPVTLAWLIVPAGAAGAPAPEVAVTFPDVREAVLRFTGADDQRHQLHIRWERKGLRVLEDL